MLGRHEDGNIEYFALCPTHPFVLNLLSTMEIIPAIQIPFPARIQFVIQRQAGQEFLGAGPLAGQFQNPVQWFYDPMAVPAFAGHMSEILTVYDCMDELSKFRSAPPEILERERELLARADLVFTGGRKLFEAKSR